MDSYFHLKAIQSLPNIFHPNRQIGIKIFWACGASNAYPFQDQLILEKPSDGLPQVNVGANSFGSLSIYSGTIFPFGSSIERDMTSEWDSTVILYASETC